MPPGPPQVESPLPDDGDFRYFARMIDILRDERERQGLTRAQLAKKAGVGNGTVGRAERYERLPSVPTVRKVARALGISWAELCLRAEKPSDKHSL